MTKYQLGHALTVERGKQRAPEQHSETSDLSTNLFVNKDSFKQCKFQRNIIYSTHVHDGISNISSFFNSLDNNDYSDIPKPRGEYKVGMGKRVLTKFKSNNNRRVVGYLISKQPFIFQVCKHGTTATLCLLTAVSCCVLSGIQ